MTRQIILQRIPARMIHIARTALLNVAHPARRAIGRRPIKAATVITLLISLYLAANPVIDRSVSALFYAADAGFHATDDPALRMLRLLGRAVTGAVVGGLLLVLAGKLMHWPPLRRVTWQAWWFLTASLAAGPGLLVNGVLKEVIGRARPLQTADFGGLLPFTPPWFPASHCADNCSFVSGEASAAIFLVAFAYVASPAWRGAVLAVTVCWAILVSLNRIAFGAHFLSDVLIGWGLTMIVVLLMREVFLLQRNSSADHWADALPLAHH